MDSISRNIILDLLPAYIAGEASEETRALVEEYARRDPEIARMIRAGVLPASVLSPEVALPDDLEIRTIKKLRRSIRHQMVFVALATAALLLIPLVAMKFTDEVQWDLFDFLVMGVLLFATGLTYVLMTRMSESKAYRIAAGIGVVAGLLLIWVNLAVGIIGSENNPANLLYLGVLAAGIIGTVTARFQPRGMARTMFLAAVVQLLVPVVAWMVWRPTLNEPPGIIGVFLLSAFFAALFALAGWLFKRAAGRPR